MIKEAPIVFKPYLKDVIWGGNRICEYKGIPQDIANIGESWEISEVPGHESVVVEGDYAGLNLTELIAKFKEELLGERVFKKYHGKFPLLIKIIDANDNLSVQVHPNDELAGERHNSLGKTEMWYIIHSEKGAKIYAGLKQSLTPEEYVERIANKTFAHTLAVHDSFPGDVFFLPAGRVHAIGAGNLLAEIQESSDITYRIYDYDRVDANGKGRELHTQQAKDAIDYKVYPEYKNAPLPEDSVDCEMVECEHFSTRRIKLDGEREFNVDKDSFTVLMCIKGEARIKCKDGETLLPKGRTALLPAKSKTFKMNGIATLIMAHS